MQDQWTIGLHTRTGPVILLSIIFIITEIVDATTRPKYCVDKLTNTTLKCFQGNCVTDGDILCDCHNGYYGKYCDKYNKAFLSEFVVGLVILIPVVMWMILQIYNRQHKVSRNSRLRKRPRRSRRSPEADNLAPAYDGPPAYSEAVGYNISSNSYPDIPFTISSSQMDVLVLPSYDDIITNKYIHGMDNTEESSGNSSTLASLVAPSTGGSVHTSPTMT